MKRIIKSLAIALSMLTAISARADIPEATLAKLFGSPYVKVERRGSVITRITFSKFEDHNFHGGECYSLILEVLRGSDGAELNGDSIPGVTIVDTHENNLGMPIWKDSQTGCEIHWVGDFRFKVTRNGKTIMTAFLTGSGSTSRFVLIPLVNLPVT
jgi:hypothetical protein